ncbi:phosphopantetheine-binding protein [Streptomyces djakartensis]|uniref:Carrier domain-containing protein n=1 Tax=Streptomyces djakartensis TaxID=68193 RepID=A0ABQ2ZH03_9ACTN|nr:phosphopantetheine-binding protein [Streptomyces djakartensis]GGY15974.1 hypothetical protein GCM10010384_22400 [Streptomyces djakartensis]
MGKNSELFPEHKTAEDIQEIVRASWEAVFETSEIDLDAYFFDLGGTSLQALQVVDRLEHELGILVPTTMLFESPTMRLLTASLAQLLADARKPESA